MSVGGVQIPTGSVLEKAQKLAQETPQQLQEFEQVLQSLEQQGGKASNVAAQASDQGSLKMNKGAEPASETERLYAEKKDEAAEPGGVEKLMTEVETGYRELNGLLEQLKGGRTFKPQELLALQTQVHHVSLQVETTTKVISEVVSNVKQLMQQQI